MGGREEARLGGDGGGLAVRKEASATHTHTLTGEDTSKGGGVM